MSNELLLTLIVSQMSMNVARTTAVNRFATICRDPLNVLVTLVFRLTRPTTRSVSVSRLTIHNVDGACTNNNQ